MKTTTHGTAERPNRSVNARTTLLVASIGGLLMVSFMVVTSSRAAFSATTANPSNSIAAGALTLADNDASAALFSYTGVYPGWTQDRCIKIDYSSTLISGTVTGAIKLYLSTIGWTPPAASTTIAGNLTMQIDMSTTGSATFGSSPSDCTGFSGSPTSILASTTLGTLNTATYTTGTSYSTWTPAGTASETRYFRFRMTLPSGTTNANVGTPSTGTFAFTWETQK